MNVIQSPAGCLFILLLAHVNDRATMETSGIAYIELLYFSIYLFITLQTVLLTPRRMHLMRIMLLIRM